MITTGPFSRLWWAGLVGSTGDWITVFATIALGARLGGEAGVLVALVSRIVPGLLLGAVIGVVTDRVDRRILILVSDIGRGLVVPLLIFATSLPILVGVNLVLELLSLVGQTPRNAMVPRLVRPENLVTANSLMLGAAYGTVPLGAGLNWLLSLFPPPVWDFIPAATAPLAFAFGVDSITFLTSAALIFTLPVMKTKLAEKKAAAPGERRAWAELRDGLVFFWTNRSVRRVIFGLTAALVGGGTMIVLGTSFVERVLDADQSGFFAIITMMGVGAALGIVAVSLYESRLVHRDLVFAASALTAGVGLAATSLTSTVAGAASWMALMGFGAGAAYVMGLTHLHEQVEDDMRGRTFATLFTLMRVGLFASMALAPPVRLALQQTGMTSDAATRVVIFVGGAVIAASGVATLWTLRHLLGRPQVGAGVRDILDRADTARHSRHPARDDD